MGVQVSASLLSSNLFPYECTAGSQYFPRLKSKLAAGVPPSSILFGAFSFVFLLLYESVTGSQYSQASESTLDAESDSTLESVSYPAGALFPCMISSGTISLVLLLLYVSDTGSQYSPNPDSKCDVELGFLFEPILWLTDTAVPPPCFNLVSSETLSFVLFA